jgi:diguanylate cyclase (GGDEF)-like protein
MVLMATRVLVVDDEKTVRGFIVQLLADEGYETIEAASAEEALQLHRDDPFPLVVTDIYMGKMTGLDLVREVKTLDGNAMVVVMTSKASLETATMALRAGAYDYLVKPFEDIEIVSAVRRAIDRHKLVADNRALMDHMKRNAEELKQLNAQLTDLANQDELTGLYNHRYFREALSKELSRSKRHSRVFSVVFIDVDHFKTYNDTHGHLAGDELLKSLAGILRQQSRESTVVVRYGGDEFMLLVPEADREGARRFAEKLRAIVEEHPFRGRESQPCGRLTVSMGVATFPESGKAAADLIDSADKALYRSKHSGRNLVSAWESSLV